MTINQLIKNSRKRKFRRSVVPELRGSPQRRGYCVGVLTMKPKKPNSANRKIARIIIRYQKRKLTVYLPGMGFSLQEYGIVLVRGGRANDLPGVRYTCVRGKFDFTEEERFARKNKRSKYGLVNPYKKKR